MERKSRILLLDDQHVLLDSLARCLKFWGYEAFKASNEEEALHWVQKEEIHLLLFDIELKSGTGYEVYEKISHVLGASWLPVIFMTGNRCQTYDAHVQQVEGACLLSKPFSPSEMTQLIEHQLRVVRDLESQK